MWDNVIQPVWNLFKGIWTDVLQPAMNTLKSGFETIWNGVGNAIKGGINLGIKAINALMGGIASLGDKLPGISISWTNIKELAAGGTIPVGVNFFAAGGRMPSAEVGAGFKTNGPRAIVGEGNPLYPEYVVPTDPRYRSRARDLYDALGNDLGVPGGKPVPRHETGGVIDAIKDRAGDVLGGVRKGAAIAAFAAPLAAANVLIDRIPKGFMRDTANSVKNKIYDFVKGEDAKLPDTPPPTAAGNAAVPTGGGVIQRIISMISGTPLLYRVTSTLRPGDDGFHGQGRAVDFAGPQPGNDTPALLSIWKHFSGFAANLKELIYSGPGATSYKNGSAHVYNEATGQATTTTFTSLSPRVASLPGRPGHLSERRVPRQSSRLASSTDALTPGLPMW